MSHIDQLNTVIMARILIVDPAPLMGDVMKVVLQANPSTDTVDVMTCTDDALETVAAYDMAIVNSEMPNAEALYFTRQAMAQRPELKVIVVGVLDDMGAIIQHIEAGAAGYVLKGEPMERLSATVEAALQDQAIAPPKVIGRLIQRTRELTQLVGSNNYQASSLQSLSRREREVLSLIALDLTNRSIARRLFLSVGTVKNHVHNILKKLKVRTRQEAASFMKASRAKTRVAVYAN